MLQQCIHGFHQHWVIQRHPDEKQKGLIPVMGVGMLGVDEPLLDRRQRDDARHRG